MFIEWSDKLKIGIESIDEEHRLLIEEFEQLYNLMREGKGHSFFDELLDFLETYIEKHVVNEERIQEIMGYDKSEEHKMIHQMFKAQVNSIINEHQGKDVTDHDLLEINRFLHSWLSNHILVEDMKIGEFYTRLPSEDKARIQAAMAEMSEGAIGNSAEAESVESYEEQEVLEEQESLEENESEVKPVIETEPYVPEKYEGD